MDVDSVPGDPGICGEGCGILGLTSRESNPRSNKIRKADS